MLFQVKYGQNYDLNKEILNFQDAVEKFLNSKTENIIRSDMKDLHYRIKTEKLEPELYFITNQRVTDDKKDKVIVYGIDQIVKTIWDELVGFPKGKKANLTLEGFMKYSDNAIIGVLSISELIKFIKGTKNYIFESNIRKYLKHTKVNKGLLKTIGDPIEIEKFFYLNNGITIVVRDFEITKDNVISLIEPQIVNGAQTSNTIFEKLNYSEWIKGSLQVTIIKEGSGVTRSEITKTRNSQNAVKGKDLISLEKFHNDVRLQLHNLGYFYETQAATWMNMKDLERLAFKGDDEVYNQYLPKKHDHRIPAFEAIQAMVAGLYQNPTKPYSSLSSYMPSGKYYPQIFTIDLEPNYRLMFYPYLIKCYGETLGYGDKNSEIEGKQYARLLFVTTYFKILFENILNLKNDEQSQIIKDPRMLDDYMKKVIVNQELLKFVDKIIVDSYFTRAVQYTEEKEISTWHNFFSKYAWDTPLVNNIEISVKHKKKDLNEIIKKFG